MDTLYHYTSLDNALSILRNGELWASRIQCMNDGLENQYLVERIDEYARDLASVDVSSEQKEITHQFVVQLKRKLSGSVWSIDFVLSFSTQRDDLSQWRAYSGSGIGCALGFNRDWIESQMISYALEPSEDALFPEDLVEWRRFVKCEYESEKHDEIFFAITKSIDEQFSILPHFEEESYQTPWAMLGAHLALRDHLPTMATVKHPAFSGEKEERIIISRMDDNGVLYRTRKSLVVPYVVFPLTSLDASIKEDLPVFNEVMIGPNPHRDANLKLVGGMFQFNPLLRSAKVSCSEIPYRDW